MISDELSSITDTIHGNILITPIEKRIISHVAFNRLHDVYQNSTAYLTFPSNRTKRFEHSVGTMYLSGKLFTSAVLFSSKKFTEPFLKKYEKLLNNIVRRITSTDAEKYKNIIRYPGLLNKKKPDPDIATKTLFTCPINYNEYEYIYLILTQSIRCAGLLHDIGHPPYSHTTESALKTLRINNECIVSSENIQNDYTEYLSPCNEFYHIMNEVAPQFQQEDDVNDDITPKLHEQMGIRLANIILYDAIDESPKNSEQNEKLLRQQLYYILIKEVTMSILKDEEEFANLHRLIDGSLDGDRLDYTTRDARNSGLDNGKIAYDRLFSNMRIVRSDEDDSKDSYLIIPSIKALGLVEDYLQNRWDVYRYIVYHHRVVKTDYLLKQVIVTLSNIYLAPIADNDRSRENNDRSKFLLENNISGLWKALKTSNNFEINNAVCQWDDSWLMTVLKKYYFENVYSKLIGNQHIPNGMGKEDYEILGFQLEELMTNTKHYYSVIKRREHVIEIDDEIMQAIINGEQRLLDSIKNLQDISRNSEKNPQNNAKNKKTLVFMGIDPFIRRLEKILKYAHGVRPEGLIYQMISKIAVAIKSKEDKNVSLDPQIIVDKAALSIRSKEFNYKSVLCEVKDYNIGLNNPVLFERYDKVVPIHNVSTIGIELDFRKNLMPPFFVYVLKSDEDISLEQFKKFRKKIGETIGENFIELCNRVLEENISRYDMQK